MDVRLRRICYDDIFKKLFYNEIKLKMRPKGVFALICFWLYRYDEKKVSQAKVVILQEVIVLFRELHVGGSNDKSLCLDLFGGF